MFKNNKDKHTYISHAFRTEKEIMKMKTENILQQPKAFHLKNKIAKIEANKIFSQ